MEENSNNPIPQNNFKPDFFIRGIAFVIDLLIYIVYFWICGLITLIILYFVNRLLISRGYLPSSDLTSTLLAYLIILDIFLIVSLPLFTLHMITIQKTGRSLGKRLLKLKINSALNSSLGFWQVILRETIFKFISFLYFGLGFFWSIWDKDNQTWHDKLAKTSVVSTSSHQIIFPRKWAYSFMILFFSCLIIAALFINWYQRYLAKLDQEYALRFSTQDLNRLFVVQDALYLASINNHNGNILCNGVDGYCEGNSTTTNYLHRSDIDGSGWVKANLIPFMSKRAGPLPQGNTLVKNYRYCSNGREWEIDITYFGTEISPKWYQHSTAYDGGDDPEALEIGSNLRICR